MNAITRIILIGLLSLVTSLVMRQNAFAQTQVAIHATQAEIDIWKQRAVEGPYKDDWDRIRSRADSFLNGPSADLWPGNQTNQAWDAMEVYYGRQGNNYHPGRARGEKLRDAGFVFLLTGDTPYRNAVRQALLDQAAAPGTDFSNKSKWSPTTTILNYDDYEIANWLRRLAYGYSYIRSSLSQSDKDKIDQFLRNAATYWDIIIHNGAKLRFPNRYQDDYSKSMLKGDDRGLTHWGGYTFYSFHYAWNNIPATHNAMVGAVAVIVNDTTLKEHAKRFVKEWLMFAVALDGTVADQYRWNGRSMDAPQWGYLYAGTAIGSIVATIDHFARDGDIELLEFETSYGFFGWEGGSKSIELVMRRFADITIGQRNLGGGIRVYASTDSTLTSDEIIGPGNTHAHDTHLIPLNLAFKDAAIIKSYSRTLPSAPFSGGYDPWGGDWGTYPGIRFMFGQNENVVWPYSFSDGAENNPPAIPQNFKIVNP